MPRLRERPARSARAAAARWRGRGRRRVRAPRRAGPRRPFSEGDVVLDEAARRLAGLVAAGRSDRGGRTVVRAPEELEPLRANFGRVALVAVAVDPLARLERALDVDRTPLAQILAGDLGLLSPHHDAVPLGAFLLLAGGVAPPVGGRHREIGDRRSALGEPNFWVATEIADQDDLVDARHDVLRIEEVGTGVAEISIVTAGTH